MRIDDDDEIDAYIWHYKRKRERRAACVFPIRSNKPASNQLYSLLCQCRTELTYSPCQANKIAGNNNNNIGRLCRIVNWMRARVYLLFCVPDSLSHRAPSSSTHTHTQKKGSHSFSTGIQCVYYLDCNYSPSFGKDGVGKDSSENNPIKSIETSHTILCVLFRAAYI